MCNLLNINRNSYYQWHRNSNNVRGSKTIILKVKMIQICQENRKVYGSHKITKILKRNFNVKELGKVWVSDITYIRCKDKWIYLTTMLDLADRKNVRWSLSEDMTIENTVYKAWIKASKNREISNDFIFHSDRGVQYAANKMTNIFKHNKKINQSMSRKGNCWDNAVAESFFKTIKCELIYRKSFKTYIEAYNQIDKYIQWYNNKRIHEYLNYLTPLEMEVKLKNTKTKRAA